MWLVIIVIIIFMVGIFYCADMDNKRLIENNEKINKKLEDEDFKISKNIYSKNYILRVSTDSQKIAICYVLAGLITYVKFNDIIECEIIEDSNTIMKGGVGRAIAGGIIAGGVGAVVGANTRKSKNVIYSLQVRIITKNINNSLININLINSPSGTEKSSLEYQDAQRFANEVYATIIAIIDSNKNMNESE